MKKLKIFISSRVNSDIQRLDAPFTLEQLREYLRQELETEKFLGQQMLDIVINETNFNGSLETDAFDGCLKTMRECDVVIILYSGEAGWSLGGEKETNGICHEEFLVAVAEFSEMSFIMDISKYFDLPQKGADLLKNHKFSSDLKSAYVHMETIKAKTIEEFKLKILKQSKQYILKATEKSFAAQKLAVSGSSVFGLTLDWSKLNYSERQAALKENLESAFDEMEVFKNTIKAYHAVPDNMSVSDARNRIGRPFLYEHKEVEGKKQTSGVIHFIAVYGNITEIQAKSLVGYPDITVIKAPFGFYLWEKNLHIQIFFLKACVNPRTLKTRFTETSTWLNSSREKDKIIQRANARFNILDAINKEKDIK